MVYKEFYQASWGCEDLSASLFTVHSPGHGTLYQKNILLDGDKEDHLALEVLFGLGTALPPAVPQKPTEFASKCTFPNPLFKG